MKIEESTFKGEGKNLPETKSGTTGDVEGGQERFLFVLWKLNFK